MALEEALEAEMGVAEENIKGQEDRVLARCRILYVFVLFLILPACSYTHHFTNTTKSGVEQLLVAKALDHALHEASLSVRGATIYVDVASLMWDEEHYIDRAFTHWFLKNGALITEDATKADLIASVLVKCAGTDGNQFYFGLPSLPIPGVNVSTPVLSVVSGASQKGYAEMEILLYRPDGGLKEKTAPLIGTSYFKRYSILFIPYSAGDIYR